MHAGLLLLRGNSKSTPRNDASLTNERESFVKRCSSLCANYSLGKFLPSQPRAAAVHTHFSFFFLILIPLRTSRPLRLNPKTLSAYTGNSFCIHSLTVTLGSSAS